MSDRLTRRAGTLLALCALLVTGIAIARVPVPPLTGRVVDLTGTLSGATVARVERQLAAFEARKGTQIAVLMVPTTQPEDIAQFGIRVADVWKLGRKGIDDGAILLIAKNDRRVRIEVGYGLEGVLPDAIANRIVMDTIAPHFRAGDFDGGVEAGVSRMISVINGEPLPPPDRRWTAEHQRGLQGLQGLFPLLLILVFVGARVLHALVGRLPGSIATGGLIGALAWGLSHLLLVGVGAGALAFGFAMLLGAGTGWSNGGGWGGFGGFGGWGGPFGGGFGGGGGGFGGGGGGFVGGGGGFGGGGASGSW